LVEWKKILEIALPIIIVGGMAIWLIGMIKPPPPKVGAEVTGIEVK